MNPSITKEGKFYSDICGLFPTTSRRKNKYVHFVYVYYFSAILTKKMNNRSDKKMIRVFTELTEYFKKRGINPGFHFVYNESSTAFKMTITTLGIKYQLFPTSNHISNDAERSIHTFKK